MYPTEYTIKQLSKDNCFTPVYIYTVAPPTPHYKIGTEVVECLVELGSLLGATQATHGLPTPLDPIFTFTPG